MRLISNNLQKWTLNQVEQFSNVVQHYIGLDNSYWCIFVHSLKTGLKYCHTFCRWVVLLHVPLQQCLPLSVYTSAVSYTPTSSFISRPSPLKMHHYIFFFLVVFPLSSPLSWSRRVTSLLESPTRMAVQHRYQAMQRRLGHMRGRQLAYHIRGRLYMCVCVHTCVPACVWVGYMGV